MSKLAIQTGHIKTASYPQGFTVRPGMVLADAHEAVAAVPTWFTTCTGLKQAITTGAVKTASYPQGFSFATGDILAAAHEAPAALPAAFVTL